MMRRSAFVVAALVAMLALAQADGYRHHKPVQVEEPCDSPPPATTQEKPCDSPPPATTQDKPCASPPPPATTQEKPCDVPPLPLPPPKATVTSPPCGTPTPSPSPPPPRPELPNASPPPPPSPVYSSPPPPPSPVSSPPPPPPKAIIAQPYSPPPPPTVATNYFPFCVCNRSPVSSPYSLEFTSSSPVANTKNIKYCFALNATVPSGTAKSCSQFDLRKIEFNIDSGCTRVTGLTFGSTVLASSFGRYKAGNVFKISKPRAALLGLQQDLSAASTAVCFTLPSTCPINKFCRGPICTVSFFNEKKNCCPLESFVPK